jgi:hypothetical protein
MVAVGTSFDVIDASGTSRIERPAHDVLLVTTTGVLTTEATTALIDNARQVIGELDGGLYAFFDCAKMTGYTSDGRKLSTDFVREHRHRHAAAVYLTSSSLVSMGINVANIVLGGFLFSTTDRAVFDARLTAVLNR